MMDTLTGLRLEHHNVTSRRPVATLMVLPIGATFYNDSRHAYGIKSNGEWREHEVPRQRGARVTLRQAWHEAREAARHQTHLPDGLNLLAEPLYSQGLILDAEAPMQGFGGCYFFEDQLTVALRTPLQPDESPDQIILIVANWFDVDVRSLSITFNPLVHW